MGQTRHGMHDINFYPLGLVPQTELATVGKRRKERDTRRMGQAKWHGPTENTPDWHGKDRGKILYPDLEADHWKIP